MSADGAVAVGPAVRRRFDTMTALGGVAASLIDGAQLPEHLPVSRGYEGIALVDHAAGAIHTRAAIRSLTERVGDRLVIDEVLAVAPRSTGGADVVAGGSTTRFDHVVVCAGRHTAQLARGMGCTVPVSLEAHVRFTFAVRAAEMPRMACLQDASGQYGEVSAYGTPQPGHGTYAVGLSRSIAVTGGGGREGGRGP